MSDLMLLGVLRMPMDDASDLKTMQFVECARAAADRIESDASQLVAERRQRQRAHEQVLKYGHHLAGCRPLRVGCVCGFATAIDEAMFGDAALADDKREMSESAPSVAQSQARGASAKKPSPPQTC